MLCEIRVIVTISLGRGDGFMVRTKEYVNMPDEKSVGLIIPGDSCVAAKIATAAPTPTAAPTAIGAQEYVCVGAWAEVCAPVGP